MIWIFGLCISAHKLTGELTGGLLYVSPCAVQVVDNILSLAVVVFL